jgi:hypothetical protein
MSAVCTEVLHPEVHSSPQRSTDAEICVASVHDCAWSDPSSPSLLSITICCHHNIKVPCLLSGKLSFTPIGHQRDSPSQSPTLPELEPPSPLKAFSDPDPDSRSRALGAPREATVLRKVPWLPPLGILIAGEGEASDSSGTRSRAPTGRYSTPSVGGRGGAEHIRKL